MTWISKNQAIPHHRHHSKQSQGSDNCLIFLRTSDFRTSLLRLRDDILDMGLTNSIQIPVHPPTTSSRWRFVFPQKGEVPSADVKNWSSRIGGLICEAAVMPKWT
ncbi:hypothetical protein TCAL_15251 [Tigriopus californicus]|uniref:Uncharacterized protein n=1 Tax=Tigriopus californicus TaxID=6832 RepID=A0A553NC32_TIGCA|nr:hypothetical protein TCAL_15251 [Tigriopus californicus]